MRLSWSPTNMERVVVAAQAIQDGLLGRNFVFGDIVCFAILGDRPALRWASNHFGEFFACGLRTEVETRTLGISQPRYVPWTRQQHTNKRAYATPFLSTRVLSRSTMIPLSIMEACKFAICEMLFDGALDSLFSWMPTILSVNFQPSPLSFGSGFKISIDWLP